MYYLLPRRKTVISCSILLVIVYVSMLYFLKMDAVWNQEPYIINWTRTDMISCHYVTEGDALSPAEDIVPPPDSIFFHETSCQGGLNSRQACAVESTARIHPDRNVYVFFNSPITDFVLKRSCLSQLTQFKNVKLARLHTEEYAKGTALEERMARRDNNQSMWRIEHTSDLLRLITMYKYGGIYLDTDMIVVKRLDALGKNWFARQDATQVNNGAMAISKDELGHNVVATILDGLKLDYRPAEWTFNGPGAITRALLTFCNVTQIVDLSAAVCHGFEVYGPDKFYPIPWYEKGTYFLPGNLTQDTMDKAYSFHLWNKVSYELKVALDSPFEKLARKYCPSVKNMFGKNFGT